MADYIGAIDQGTTSTRFIVFDKDGEIVTVDQREHEQINPKAGWVEHDAKEIWKNTRGVIGGALANSDLEAGDIAAVGSPTSARRPSSGTARPATRSTTR